MWTRSILNGQFGKGGGRLISSFLASLGLATADAVAAIVISLLSLCVIAWAAFMLAVRPSPRHQFILDMIDKISDEAISKAETMRSPARAA